MPAPFAMLVGAGLAAVMGILAYQRRAARADRANTLGSWAAWQGYEEVPAPTIGSTALLRAPGERGQAYGVPVAGLQGAIYPLVVRVGSGDDRTEVETTAVQVFLAAGFPHFSIRPTGRERLPDNPSTSELTLESAELAERAEVATGKSADPQRFRELFTPALIVWLLDQPAVPLVQYEMGALIVAAARPAETSADLDLLLSQADHLGRSVLAVGAISDPR